MIVAMILSSALLLGSEGLDTYGKPLSLEEITPIAQILENFGELEGQRVRVEGKITEVCAMKGCWIEIEDSAGDRIRVKVDDGVIVFPTDAQGSSAVAEGLVEVVPMTQTQYTSWLQHLAEETGRTFDPESVGGPPYQLVRLRGLGAEVRTRPSN